MWTAFPDYPDYEISDAGEVRRAQSVAGGGYKAGTKITPKPGSSGYLTVHVGPKHARKALLLHRVVARAFIGEPPTPEYQCAHYDGDILNNHADNLRWATCAENHADKKRHGTHISGEKAPWHKLKDAQVSEIRSLYAGGDVSQKSLADRFGISQAHISRLIQGQQRSGSA